MGLLQDEMKTIIKTKPHYSAADVINELRKGGWQIEYSAEISSTVLGAVPGWTLLLNQSLSAQSQKHQKARAQLINTGQYYAFSDLGTNNRVEPARVICNKYFCHDGHPPVSFQNMDDLDRDFITEWSLEIARKIILTLTKSHSLEDDRYSLLMNRCLIRRTYSDGEWSERFRNSNNQHWHQDSNPLFGNRPMLTVWVPLHDGAGRSRPGIEISDLVVPEFSAVYGDGTESIEEILSYYKKPTQQAFIPTVPAGDAIAFNGLTFHRTAVRQNMRGHRDVLLLRVCRSDDRSYFPGDRSQDLDF